MPTGRSGPARISNRTRDAARSCRRFAEPRRCIQAALRPGRRNRRRHYCPARAPPRAPFDRVAVLLHAPHAAHHRVEFGHFESDMIERRQFGLGQHDRAMIGISAVQEPQRPILVDQPKAERLREEGKARVEVARVEVNVRDLARRSGASALSAQSQTKARLRPSGSLQAMP